MRALSLTQPWASAVAILLKQWETRSWRTNYRGPVAIHASKAFPRSAKAYCHEWPWSGVIETEGFKEFLLAKHAIEALPVGALIATTNIVACHPTEEVLPSLSPAEALLGDYGADRWAWKFEGTIALPEPVPCKGALSLWTVPEEQELLVRLQFAT